VPIYLAQKPSKKTSKINGINYRQMMLDYLKTGEAYQIEIIWEKGCYYIHVSIEEETPIPDTLISGAVGVDTNPDGLGIACADYRGQFKESQWQSLSECTYARSARRENLMVKPQLT
jgi:transposase